MKKYLLMLLLFLTSSPGFSSNLEGLHEEFTNRVSNRQTKSQDVIEYLEIKKGTSRSIYDLFLKNKYDEVEDYPTYIAMTTNRPELFKYFLDNDARLSDRSFKKDIKGTLAPFLAGDSLSEEFIPLIKIALQKKMFLDSTVNEFFSYLYVTFMPKHRKRYIKALDDLQITEESVSQLNKQMKETVDERDIVKQQKTELSEELNRTKEILHKSSEDYREVLEENKRVTQILIEKDQTLQERSKILEEITKSSNEKDLFIEQLRDGFTRQVKFLTEENDLIRQQDTEFELVNKELMENLYKKQEELRVESEALKESREKLKESEEVIERLGQEKDDLEEQNNKAIEKVKIVTEENENIKQKLFESAHQNRELSDVLLEKDKELQQLYLDGVKQYHELDSLTKENTHFREQQIESALVNKELTENLVKQEVALSEQSEKLNEYAKKVEEERKAREQLTLKMDDLTKIAEQTGDLTKENEFLRQQNLDFGSSVKSLQESLIAKTSEKPETIVVEKVVEKVVASQEEPNANVKSEDISLPSAEMVALDAGSAVLPASQEHSKRKDSLMTHASQAINDEIVEDQKREGQRTLKNYLENRFAEEQESARNRLQLQTATVEKIKSEQKKSENENAKRRKVETDLNFLQLEIDAIKNRAA